MKIVHVQHVGEEGEGGGRETVGVGDGEGRGGGHDERGGGYQKTNERNEGVGRRSSSLIVWFRRTITKRRCLGEEGEGEKGNLKLNKAMDLFGV